MLQYRVILPFCVGLLKTFNGKVSSGQSEEYFWIMVSMSFTLLNEATQVYPEAMLMALVSLRKVKLISLID